jgi:hypothetical protein
MDVEQVEHSVVISFLNGGFALKCLRCGSEKHIKSGFSRVAVPCAVVEAGLKAGDEERTPKSP